MFPGWAAFHHAWWNAEGRSRFETNSVIDEQLNYAVAYICSVSIHMRAIIRSTYTIYVWETIVSLCEGSGYLARNSRSRWDTAHLSVTSFYVLPAEHIYRYWTYIYRTCYRCGCQGESEREGVDFQWKPVQLCSQWETVTRKSFHSGWRIYLSS